jgi:AraC-like DNA-binding protein
MPEEHRARVIASPWEGVYCTHIDSARHFSKHWHTTHGVGLLEHGAQRSASGRGSVEAFAGDLITTNPGEVHDGQPLGGPSRRWRMVYFDAGVIASVAEPTGRDIELEHPVLRDARLSQTLRALFDRIEAWAGQSALSAEALACEESLVTACALLLNQHTSQAPIHSSDTALADVRDRLADAPQDAPSLSALAHMAGLSKYQLLRRFAQAYGITPHAWLLQRRAEHARGFITRGDDLVQAAMSAGFADQSHMTRIFTRQFGFTPGAWQQAMVLPRNRLQ